MEKSSELKKHQDYPIHWIQMISNQIEERNMEQIVLATGKTPSGFIHLGIMRELLICDGLYRIFKNKDKNVRFILFIDDLDAAKRFPSYIPEEISKKYLGYPFHLIPNPILKDDRSYAKYFGEDLISTFSEIGISANVIWTHNLYKKKEMKEMIRIGLKKNILVKEIIAKYITHSMTDEQKQSFLEQQKDWMGAMVICEKCNCTQQKLKDGTIVPNRVLSYNEEKDECTYHCPKCGYENSIKISSGKIKLNWRLDWPAKWKIFQTTCEPAGKDHCTPGGSYDTGLELCQKIYNYEGPIKVAYEWVRLGDKDMGTSKGVVFTPKKFLEMVDPEILRMLIYQTNISKHLSIRIEELEQYYNEYDRIEKIYFKISQANSDEEQREIEFLYPLMQVKNIPEKKPIRLPFKLLTVLSQLKPIFGIDSVFKRAQEYVKNEGIEDKLDFKIFSQRLEKVTNWLNYMKELIEKEKNPQEKKKLRNKAIFFSIPKSIPQEIKIKLDDTQKDILKIFLEQIESVKELSEENIKDIMVFIREDLKIKPMKIFQAFYLIILGEKKGPRLSPLLMMLDKEWIIKRIKNFLN
ncbi:MAG: lysine--tRNA ligase [Promethearchaeota archaeon]